MWMMFFAMRKLFAREYLFMYTQQILKAEPKIGSVCVNDAKGSIFCDFSFFDINIWVNEKGQARRREQYGKCERKWERERCVKIWKKI